MNYNYQELIPDEIIDIFYNKIEKCILEERSYDLYLNILLLLNLKVPKKIKKIIDHNK